MKKITWLFDTVREAEAFAEGIEYVNEPAVSVAREGVEVVTEDFDGDDGEEVRDRTTGDGPTNLWHATTGEKR